MAKLVSKVYGDALFEASMEASGAAADAATGKQDIDTVFEEVSVMAEIWKENPDLNLFLNNPQIVKEEKLSILNQIFAGKISQNLMGFLAIIVEKDRQKDIPDIYEYFLNRVKEYKKIGTVSVTSAVDLSPAQKEQVEKKLLETTGCKKLDIAYAADKSLIGGMIIRIGDRVVDSSVKTQLYNLRRDLSSIQLG